MMCVKLICCSTFWNIFLLHLRIWYYHLSCSEISFTYTFRYSKFQSVANITLHFPDNFGGNATQIQYIGFKGEATQVNTFSESGVCLFVLVFRSFTLCFFMNSWRGMLLQQLFMNSCQILLITSKSLLSLRIRTYWSFIDDWMECSFHRFKYKHILFGRLLIQVLILCSRCKNYILWC